MTIGELLITNKDRYTKVFLIENDSITNKAVFTRVMESTVKPEMIEMEAKDYFMLDKEAIDEIFGNSDELEIAEDDLVLLIGL